MDLKIGDIVTFGSITQKKLQTTQNFYKIICKRPELVWKNVVDNYYIK